jgi:membrane-bound ClpP family serine protease
MNRLKQIKSTIIGILLFLSGLGIQLYEYMVTQEIINGIYPFVMMLLGIGFLFATDKIINIIFGWLKNNSGNKF